MNSNQILLAPVLSEKATNAKGQKKYVFEVAMDSNKIEIKKAVEELYKVKVDSVNIVVVKPKPKRVRYRYGLTRMFKKAIVTLSSGEIDFYKL
ncbi:MAG: 50S ribosomal protein L23 [Brevinematales bacterium]|nr:50S ribosomal protein L23 [Brevinematales bacterium]